MKVFSKEEIDQARAYFESQGFSKVDADVGGRQFSYFVLPQALEPRLPNFVSRMTGKPEDGMVFGISDSVDSDYRDYAVAHEYIEFVELGIDTPNRCVLALEEELKLVPDEIKPDYIPMRATFFRDLIDYCSAQPEFYTSDDLRQFRENAEKLEALI